MTSNQTKAVVLAEGIARGRIADGELTDDDWMLLVLAAGLNCAAVSPTVVCRRVLRNACDRTGYFHPVRGIALGPQPAHA